MTDDDAVVILGAMLARAQESRTDQIALDAAEALTIAIAAIQQQVAIPADVLDQFEDKGAANVLRVYLKLHEGKIGAHWLWCVIGRMAAGEREDVAMRDYGYYTKQAGHGEAVAWMDDFGNTFPLAANKGAASWRDEHKRHWQPLYTAPPRVKVTRAALDKAWHAICLSGNAVEMAEALQSLGFGVEVGG